MPQILASLQFYILKINILWDLPFLNRPLYTHALWFVSGSLVILTLFAWGILIFPCLVSSPAQILDVM